MRRMRCRWMVTVLCLWSSVSSGPADATVRVVATIFPVADMVRQVGKDAVEVVTLLPPGASPHTFEPTPAQIREIAHARLFICVGAGLDTWTTKLLAAQAGAITVVTLTDGLQLLGAAGTSAAGTSAVGTHGGDPHVWLDPVLVRDHMVPAIVVGLSRVDPDGRAAFERAAGEFRAALTSLDADIRDTLAPLANRNYVAFHSAWRYFGQRYNLHEVAAVEAFPGKEPSAKEIAAIVEKARAARVRVVLIEPQFNPRVAQQIAREFGGQALVVDPIGGPDVPGRSHYTDLMRDNSRVFAEALR